ncbi:hypothetical protein [Flavisericum labens]|uniref:hypothetical protein n=1 Tax=Flavisericum labens TaxID=3377112 RepID=UPI00387AB312
MPYSKENVIFARVLGGILHLRVTKTAREAEGGAYSPSARASFVDNQNLRLLYRLILIAIQIWPIN